VTSPAHLRDHRLEPLTLREVPPARELSAPTLTSELPDAAAVRGGGALHASHQVLDPATVRARLFSLLPESLAVIDGRHVIGDAFKECGDWLRQCSCGHVSPYATYAVDLAGWDCEMAEAERANAARRARRLDRISDAVGAGYGHW